VPYTISFLFFSCKQIETKGFFVTVLKAPSSLEFRHSGLNKISLFSVVVFVVISIVVVFHDAVATTVFEEILFFFLNTRCQFHQHFMYEFFVQTLFWQLFSSYMYVTCMWKKLPK